MEEYKESVQLFHVVIAGEWSCGLDDTDIGWHTYEETPHVEHNIQTHVLRKKNMTTWSMLVMHKGYRYKIQKFLKNPASIHLPSDHVGQHI